MNNNHATDKPFMPLPYKTRQASSGKIGEASGFLISQLCDFFLCKTTREKIKKAFKELANSKQDDPILLWKNRLKRFYHEVFDLTDDGRVIVVQNQISSYMFKYVEPGYLKDSKCGLREVKVFTGREKNFR